MTIWEVLFWTGAAVCLLFYLMLMAWFIAFGWVRGNWKGGYQNHLEMKALAEQELIAAGKAMRDGFSNVSQQQKRPAENV